MNIVGFKNKKGFTLVELLVAATIIGVLAVFATSSYRSSVAETRWAQAKANLDQLANAVQRFKMDYPNVRFTKDAMVTLVSCSKLFPSSTASIQPGCLIPYGYLDGSDWAGGNYLYYICDQTTSAPCDKQFDSGTIERPLACVKVSSGAKLPSKYKSYVYCFFSGYGGKEYYS